MVAYSFQKQFRDPILSGTKRQTIRAVRKSRHARPGERLQLYTGMRTKYCRLIGTATCQTVSPITINFVKQSVSYEFGQGTTTVFPGGLDEFARGDGFADWAAMRAFWEKAHGSTTEFNGWLIRWTDFSEALASCREPAAWPLLPRPNP
jgi:hypothetical protein